MLPRCPIAVAVFLFFFPAARVSAAGDPGPRQQSFHKAVGDSVLFHVDIPKGAVVADLFLRTTLKKDAVAFWQPGKTLNVVSGKYSGRVTYSEDTHSFNVSSLRLADGELYEVSMSPQEPTETVINTYRLSVFNISATAKKLDNSSCSLGLLCQAGMGPGATVAYTWKSTGSGPILARSSLLWVVVDPAEKDTSYTCTADVTGFQSQWNLTPYEQFCSSGVAGLFKPGFLACSFVPKTLLVPLLVTVSMLL